MLAEQRIRAILQQLAQHQTVSVTELCQTTGASEATIRRDLNALANQGKLVKIHGGATTFEEEDFLVRETELAMKQRYALEKEQIARYAASLVTDDDVVYLDASTTVLHMANHLKDSKALFITSSIDCAGMLSAHERRIYVLGGQLKPGTVEIVGGEALNALSSYNFTKTFLGVGGVSLTQGLTAPDPASAVLKVRAAAQSQSVYILADSSKFGCVTAASVMPLDAAKIVTDKRPEQAYMERADITVI